MRRGAYIQSSTAIPAVGYVRCSTDMQDDSPDQQKKEIQQFAKDRGYVVTEWFVDFGKSGTTFEHRPEFMRLYHVVENGHTFRAVIVYDESRWGRAIDSDENTYWKVLFRKQGVSVVLVKTSIDPRHEYAPMLESFESIQASHYSKKLSELTMRGAMNNDKFSNGGTAPYGYKRMAFNIKTGVTRLLSAGEWCVKGQEKVYWVLGEEDEVKTVRFIFEQRANGLACILIARALNNGAVPCAKRGKWRNLDRKWSNGTIRSILENPAYYGARAYNRYSTSKIIAQKKNRYFHPATSAPAWRNPRGEWHIVEDAHPGIVTKDLWENANNVKRSKVMSSPNGHAYRSRYLLTGLIRCSECGFAFQGWSGRVRGKEYLRYIDGGWQSKRVCSFLSIPKDKLEDFAIAAIKETLSDPEMVKNIEESLRKLLDDSATERAGGTKLLDRELKDIDQRIKNLLTLAEEGHLEGPSVASRLRDLEDAKLQIQRQMSQGDVRLDQPQLIDIRREVADFVFSFEKNFANAPIEERKILVKKCISKIEVDRKEKVARFYVRRLPIANPKLEEIVNFAANRWGVMSTECARNRT